MPELIDRAKLLEYLAAIKPDEYVSAYGEAAVDIINHIETYVNAMPTIEPEVRHGRWKGWTTSKFTGKYEDYDEPVYKDYVYYTCSECYRKSAIQELYCPRCGAQMDATEPPEKE